MRLGGFSQPTASDSALALIESLVREQFSLDEEAIVIVNEEYPVTPGFPPTVTRIRFWTAPMEQYSYSLFKAAVDVGRADLPPSWWREAMRDHGDGFCSCC